MEKSIWSENKTLKEWLSIMPKIFLDRAVFILLICWCCLPLIIMTINLIDFKIVDNVHFMVMLSLGLFGILFGAIYHYQAINESTYVKRTFREYIATYGDRFFLLAMLIWGFFSCFFAKDISLAFFSNSYRKDGFISYIAYAGFFIAALILKEEKYRKRLLYVFSTVATIMSFVIILQFRRVPVKVFVNVDGMYTAIFDNSNHFGYYLVMAILIVAGLFVVSHKKIVQLLLLIEFAILSYALCINDTFGSYLGVCVALLSALIGYSIIKKQNAFKIIIIVVAFILISYIFNLQYATIEYNFAVLFNDTSKIIRNADDSNMAGTNRWELWCDSVNFIKKRPIFGYGIEGYRNAYIENHKGMIIDRPHNEYLQHALFMGIPASAFYLASLFWILIRAVKNRKLISKTTQVAIFAMIAYLGSAFFGNTMYYTLPYFMIILAMASKIESS